MLDQKEIVSNELNVLDGTMTYAEEQVGYVPNVGNMNPGTEEKLINISKQQKAAYQEYLIHAYGKGIRIESELQGEMIFRLSQSAAIFTNKKYQIATPDSPIGRVVSIARVGQEYESKAFGEYKVLDVLEFDRYRGTDVVTQRRNFARMAVSGTLKFVLTNLKNWLNEQLVTRREQEQREKKAQLALEARKLEERQQDEIIRQREEACRKAEEQKAIAREGILKSEEERREAEQRRKAAEAAEREAAELRELEALEDMEKLTEDEELMGLFESSQKDIKRKPIEAERQPEIPEPQSIGLSARFYVNLNEKQYDTAHLGQKGLAVVEGVAGSGKTSVALSRTKSLVQLSQLPLNHERYTPDFDPQAQIGVVRTGELIQYLKDTCQELELHNFPVKEYSDIRDKLRHEWNLVGTRSGNRRFKHLPNLSYLPDSETRIEWANFVSNRMAELIKNETLFQIEELKNSESSISLVGLQYAYHIFQEKLPSKLYGLLATIDRLTNEVVDELFDRTIWLGWKDSGPIHWLRVPNESPIPLMMDSPNSFCLTGINQLYAVTLVIPLFGLSNWRAWLPAEGCLVDQEGEPVSEFNLEMALEDKNFSNIRWKSFISNSILEFEPFVLLNIETLDDKVLLDQIYQQRLAIFKECKLVKLRNQKGKYEKEQIYSYRRPYQIFDMPAVLRGDEKIGDLQMKRLVRSETRDNMKKKLISIFSKTLNSPVDLYIKTIDKIDAELSIIPNDDLEHTRQRLNDRRLADVDIDLLLLLTMELLYGAGKNPLTRDNYLVEPDYYAAVFIDEVQDFTEIQVRLMSMLADPRYRVVTVVGDMGQRLHRPSVSNLASCFMPEHWGSAHHVQLTENIRQSRVAALNWLSSNYRACFIDQHDYFIHLPNDKQGVQIYHLDVLAQPKLILPLLQDIPSTWTAVVVWPDQKSAAYAADFLRDELAKGFVKTQFANHLDLSKRFMIHQTIPQHIKGLEFDCLIMVGAERYELKNVIAINEVYVCLSRPTQRLVIVGQLNQLDQRFAQLLSHFQ